MAFYPFKCVQCNGRPSHPRSVCVCVFICVSPLQKAWFPLAAISSWVSNMSHSWKCPTTNISYQPYVCRLECYILSTLCLYPINSMFVIAYQLYVHYIILWLSSISCAYPIRSTICKPGPTISAACPYLSVQNEGCPTGSIRGGLFWHESPYLDIWVTW